MPSNTLHPLALTTMASMLMLFYSGGAAAQSQETRTLAPITVKAQGTESALEPVSGYIAHNALTATKTDTPLSETPQSVTVVTSDEIRDQGAQGVQDALNYAAGVRSDAYGLDSRTDSFRIRGSEPTVYMDGLRQNYNWYTSTTRIEPYALERIEVLRGPASMLYGQGSTAGVVNMVSKRPLPEAMREVGISYGSNARRQIQADLTGPLNEEGTWLYRVVAVGREANTQVDFVRDDRLMIAPSLTWQPNASTSLTFMALYQDDKSGSTSQFFPWEGVALDNPNGQLPVDRFIGDPDWDRYDSRRKSAGWAFRHDFNDDWSFKQNFRWSLNRVDYRSLYSDFFTLRGGWAGDPVNKRMLGRVADATLTTVRMVSADQNLEGRFDTGAVRHHVLLGMDMTYAHQDKESGSAMTDYTNNSGGAVPLIDAYDPDYPAFTPPSMSTDPVARQRDLGVYLQDELRWRNWIAVAGLRHDRSESSVEGQPDYTNRATTKRLGIMYKADNGLSPYLSYSESFSPVFGTDANGDAFIPLRGKQVEAGLKYESQDGDTMFNIAAYTLSEENRLVPDPTNPNNQVQIGKTRNRGVELEYKQAIGRSLSVLANYTYIDIDDQLEGIPKHQASVWGKYRFAMDGAAGLSVGAGVRWLGHFTDGIAPQTPSVTLVDAMVAYETPSWRLALNVNNMFDKTYVSTCLSRGDCWYGSQRTIVASASYRF